MRKNARTLRTALLLALLVLTTACAQGLGGELAASPGATPLPPAETATQTPAPAPTRTLTPTDVHAVETVQAATLAARTVCSRQAPLFLLALGIDENEQADAIRVVRIDFLEPQVRVVGIPRDLWLPIPGIEDEGIRRGRINAAYGYGEAFLGLGRGAELLGKTLEANYGIPFERFTALHFSTFTRLVDAIGGVDLFLPAPIGAYSVSGDLHLDGAAALRFVRERRPDSDLYRLQRQAAFLQALFRKLVQPVYLVQLPGLGASMMAERGLVTNLTPGDIAALSCLAGLLQPEAVTFVEIPTGYVPGVINENGAYIRQPAPELDAFLREGLGLPPP